jgi:hypothetical protein
MKLRMDRLPAGLEQRELPLGCNRVIEVEF